MQPEDFEKTKRSSGPLRLIAFSAAGFILLGALAVAAGNCAVQTGGTPAAASPLQISEYMSSNNAHSSQRSSLIIMKQRRMNMSKLTYMRCGDYDIPNLKLSEQPETSVGKYGRMRRSCL